MTINSDINVLGSLSDFNLINVFLNESIDDLNKKGGFQAYSVMKTDKSVKRFEKAITGTFLSFKHKVVETLIRQTLNAESISSDSLMLLLWNASFNNELFSYLNNTIYFNAFYSGRMTIKQDEVASCLKELKQIETDLQKWSESTIAVTASKYLTLLKKFNLMEGSANKTIIHPYLDDKMFVLFIYWLLAVETKPNVLNSPWLNYCFLEKPFFIERILQKKFIKFFHINYTGDRLSIEPIISYENIYNAITQS
jgi:Putative inner membrane protein (DUF1819)